MNHKWKTVFAFAATACIVLLCGLLLWGVLLPMVLFGRVDEVITFPAMSQFYYFAQDVEDNDITEAQEAQYYGQAQELFQEVFGIVLEDDHQAGISYSGNKYEGYTIHLLWIQNDGNGQGTEMQSSHYEALLKQEHMETEARLVELGFFGTAASVVPDTYIKEAESLFSSQLNRKISEYDQVTVDVWYFCEEDNVQMTMYWLVFEDGDKITSYSAAYEYCDLVNATGQIESLGVHVIGQNFVPALFGQSERVEAIETLRAFGIANDIPLGIVLEQKPWDNLVDQDALSITFQLEGDGEDQRNIRFIIGRNYSIYKYEYIS